MTTIITDVTTVADFLDKYYKHDRYKGRGTEYAKKLLESFEKEFSEDGETFISCHDSVLGHMTGMKGGINDAP